MLKFILQGPREDFRRRQWHPTPVLLPRKSHGWRSLVDCSPWGCEQSDTTERLPFHFSFSCIGEGNGNPLQCSCLENPRDWGAWWAAVYGLAQSRTRLKWLSSSRKTSLLCQLNVSNGAFHTFAVLKILKCVFSPVYAHRLIYNQFHYHLVVKSLFSVISLRHVSLKFQRK